MGAALAASASREVLQPGSRTEAVSLVPSTAPARPAADVSPETPFSPPRGRVGVEAGPSGENPTGLKAAERPPVATRVVTRGDTLLRLTLDVYGFPLDDVYRRVLEHNPLVSGRPALQRALWKRFMLPRLQRRLQPFREAYNREAAREIRRRTRVPLILVGGIRSRAAMDEILESRDADVLALCRPLIREPDLADRLRAGSVRRSTCTNCNACAVMCDTTTPLRCYQKETRHDHRD